MNPHPHPVPGPPGAVEEFDAALGPGSDPQRLTRRDAAQVRWQRTVPARFAHAPTTCMYTEVIAWVQQLINAAENTPHGRIATGPSMVLTGGTGTGKTHAAWWAVGHLARAGVLTTWEVTTSTDLYAALRPRTGVDSEAEFQRFANSPLLVLDDAGAFKQSEWTVEVDYRLINHRYNHMLPTMLTSNLPPRRGPRTPPELRTLEDVMEDRVLSRLTEMAEGNVLPLQMGDRRRIRPA